MIIEPVEPADPFDPKPSSSPWEQRTISNLPASPPDRNKKAVHFGAGNIGRGFIGLVLSQSGYQVSFVDVNEALVQLLQSKKSYIVELAHENPEPYVVQGVSAIPGQELDLVAAAIAEADLVTTAVGVNALKFIAPALALGLDRRIDSNRDTVPLAILACENAIGASSQLKELVRPLLSEESISKLQLSVFFPDTAVDRIVPLQHHSDPLLVTVEPFYEWTIDASQWPGELERITGAHYVEQLQPYIERKLFTVNTGHCIAAYLGHLHNCHTVQEALRLPSIRAIVRGALAETGEVLIQTYGFERKAHLQYIELTLERFANPFVEDEVDRVGRSPIRKLSPTDRILRPLLLAYNLGLSAEHLCTAIAAALLFDQEEDSESIELQHYIQVHGASQAITFYTGLPTVHPLHREALKAYDRLLRLKLNFKN